MSALVPLRPAYRQLRRICARCRGPFGEDHICHDRLRSPAFGRYLEAMRAIFASARALWEREGGRAELRIDRLLAAWSGRELTALDDVDAEILTHHLDSVLAWAQMPAHEQEIANLILYETLSAMSSEGEEAWPRLRLVDYRPCRRCGQPTGGWDEEVWACYPEAAPHTEDGRVWLCPSCPVID